MPLRDIILMSGVLCCSGDELNLELAYRRRYGHMRHTTSVPSRLALAPQTKPTLNHGSSFYSMPHTLVRNAQHKRHRRTSAMSQDVAPFPMAITATAAAMRWHLS
jgi:hypothetical protein